jgi:hypothetical protein
MKNRQAALVLPRRDAHDRRAWRSRRRVRERHQAAGTAGQVVEARDTCAPGSHPLPAMWVQPPMRNWILRSLLYLEDKLDQFEDHKARLEDDRNFEKAERAAASRQTRD